MSNLNLASTEIDAHFRDGNDGSKLLVENEVMEKSSSRLRRNFLTIGTGEDEQRKQGPHFHGRPCFIN
jgi:hypothetical protein